MSTASTAPVLDLSRERLREAFASTRRYSEALCEPLATEDYVIQTMPDVSPTKWHLAHASWFFERFVLRDFAPDYAPFHERYDYLFNSYYNAVGPMHCRPNRGLLSRPTVAEVYDYRRAVDDRIADLIDGCDTRALAAISPRITLGIHHEQQHQELMVADLKHVFSSNPLLPAYREMRNAEGGMQDFGSSHSASDIPQCEFVAFAGGVREIGCDGDSAAFCFDNETPRHRVYVQDFQLASRLTTNGEYLRFIEDGGYRRPELWLSLGWTTVQQEGWDRPIYWYRDADGRWMHYTLAGPRPIDPHEPVCHVSYFEAEAFARWAGARLPTEAEWETAAENVEIEGNFAETGALHPIPAPDSSNPSIRPASLQGLYGDVWEWTQSPYAPYPGYRPAAGALGEYNGKFMCNQYVLRGGSCATPASHMRPTYRNFFPPHARWQFAGLRLAKDG